MEKFNEQNLLQVCFPESIWQKKWIWIWRKTTKVGFNDCPRTWLKYGNATTAEQRLQPPCKKDLQNVNAGRKLKIPQLWPEHRPQHVLQTDVDWLDDQQTYNQRKFGWETSELRSFKNA